MNPYELAALLDTANDHGYCSDAAKEIRKLCAENTNLFDFLHNTNQYGLYLAFKALNDAGETELAKTVGK
jgi:hypothetical protein